MSRTVSRTPEFPCVLDKLEPKPSAPGKARQLAAKDKNNTLCVVIYTNDNVTRKTKKYFLTLAQDNTPSSHSARITCLSTEDVSTKGVFVINHDYATVLGISYDCGICVRLIDSLATKLLFNGPAGWSHKVDVLDITADTLFIYRLYIVWGNRTKVIIIPIILLIAAYLIGFIGVFQEPGGFSYLAPSSREKKIDAIALFILSFANLLVTTLIGFGGSGKSLNRSERITFKRNTERFLSLLNSSLGERLESGTIAPIAILFSSILSLKQLPINAVVLLTQIVGIVPASITVRINMGVSTEGSNNITNNPIHPNKLYAPKMKDKQIADSGLPGDLIWNPEPWQNHSSSSFGEGLDEEFSFNVKPVMPKKVAREENSYVQVSYGRGRRYYHGRGGRGGYDVERNYDSNGEVVLDIRHHSRSGARVAKYQ
ncbi:hypothetical protein K435DRAFT_813814 [Dendrothele bispora CBS 962.96]|uniref:Uncharacterized protein n=1 Tax=Dendrothele bispora (strain CBS 962.96) TaxID=1314807 RepID=A0A4S8KLF1_DENBC|nr:hypothetical protein K435DRAFT_813814 [Dendrothele bispora CBS 962.96]